MYFKQCIGFLLIRKSADISSHVEYDSKLWEIWRANLTPTTCLHCASMNGRIFSVGERIGDTIPVHPNYRCYVEALKAITVIEIIGFPKHQDEFGMRRILIMPAGLEMTVD